MCVTRLRERWSVGHASHLHERDRPLARREHVFVRSGDGERGALLRFHRAADLDVGAAHLRLERGRRAEAQRPQAVHVAPYTGLARPVCTLGVERLAGRPERRSEALHLAVLRGGKGGPEGLLLIARPSSSHVLGRGCAHDSEASAARAVHRRRRLAVPTTRHAPGSTRARASSPAQREDRARSQCRSALQETDPERIAAIRSQAKNYALLVQSVTVQKVRATQLAPARISRLPASHAHRRVTFSRR